MGRRGGNGLDVGVAATQFPRRPERRQGQVHVSDVAGDPNEGGVIGDIDHQPREAARCGVAVEVCESRSSTAWVAGRHVQEGEEPGAVPLHLGDRAPVRLGRLSEVLGSPGCRGVDREATASDERGGVGRRRPRHGLPDGQQPSSVSAASERRPVCRR
jgi:hypothetical protein